LRIGPNELHISDVHQYKVIYNQTKPFPKHGGFYDAFNTPHSIVTETDAELHRERRRLLNPLFSRAGAFKLEPIIHEKVGIMLGKINRLKDSHDINVYNAFRYVVFLLILLLSGRHLT
jgi:cytochrome P450